MKTKLLALALLAAGSMFAQTRFSFGITLGSNRGYQPQPAPYAYAQGYNSAQAQPYQQPSYNNRFDNGSASQSYTRGRDAYGRQADARSYNQNQHQNVDRDDDRDNHDRNFEQGRDSDDHERGYSQDNRQQNNYGNGFRNR